MGEGGKPLPCSVGSRVRETPPSCFLGGNPQPIWLCLCQNEPIFRPRMP